MTINTGSFATFTQRLALVKMCFFGGHAGHDFNCSFFPEGVGAGRAVSMGYLFQVYHAHSIQQQEVSASRSRATENFDQHGICYQPIAMYARAVRIA